ncbi:MAG: DNA primase [Thiomargarita sp.]|nr:DNA primase [Thiomargarita sp.]
MAGYIDRNFIEELITRVNIVELIDHYLNLRKTGQNYKACCPFHQEKTPSFIVNPDKQFYHCFGCGAGGNAIRFIMEYAQLDFVEAVHEIANKIGIEVIYEPNESGAVQHNQENANQYQQLYTINAQAAYYYRQQLRQSKLAQDYLKQRGLTGEVAREFGIGYAPANWQNLINLFPSANHEQLFQLGLIKKSNGSNYDVFRDRIIYPILDRRKRIIAFGGRLIAPNDKAPKYLNSPATILFQKSQEVYGWHLATQNRQQVIVVEGYMDVIALAQYGITNSVATLGTACTTQQLELLFRRVTDIVFCFDGDVAGQQAAWRALKSALPLLKDKRQVSFVFLATGFDPDSLVRSQGEAGFNNCIKQALPLSKFLFQQFKTLDLTTVEGKTKLIEEVKPLLQLLPLGTYRDLVLQELEQLTKIEQTFLAANYNQPPPSNNIKPVSSMRQLSLAQQGMVYLLYKSELHLELDANSYNKLVQLEQKEVALLLDIVILCRKAKSLGVILEHFRATEYEPLISQLLPHQVGLAIMGLELKQEFAGVIRGLCKEFFKQRFLVLNQSLPNLSADEKLEYLAILKAG